MPLLKDMKTNINIPFVMRYNPRSKLFELISKTIMRKKNFLTRDKNIFQVTK